MKIKYVLLLILITSCSNLKPRIKNISPKKVIDQIEQLKLYGTWRNGKTIVRFNCSGRISIDYNYNNIRYKDFGGHITRIDTQKKIIFIKEAMFESSYKYQFVKEKLKILKVKNSQENLFNGPIEFVVSKSKEYDCKVLRNMGPVELTKYYLDY